MYLFTINTIFIALSTFLVLKVLQFPMLKYANSAKRKRIARFASILAIIVMIPAIWTFVNVLKESNFKKDVKQSVVAFEILNLLKKFYSSNSTNHGLLLALQNRLR